MLRIEEHSKGSVMVVQVNGRLRLENSELLKDKIRSLIFQGYRRFVINLEATRIMDAVGFGALVEAGTAVREAGGHLVLAEAKPNTAQLLIMTGVFTHFALFDTEREALGQLEQPEPKAEQEAATVATRAAELAMA